MSRAGERLNRAATQAKAMTRPGSPEAVAAGCTCPVMDNAHGAGRYGIGEVAGWWVTDGCPLHGRAPTPPAGEGE